MTAGAVARFNLLHPQLSPMLYVDDALLDPIEHGILWVALTELSDRPDVPFRVSISEAVELAKRFGATDGHKFVNGVLDRAASALRPDERGP